MGIISQKRQICVKKAGGQEGSTIIEALVAMMFIGIVAAEMVKNTASQSAAAVSYSTMAEMNSTISSGAMATESFFASNGNKQQILDMLTDIRETPSNLQPIYGGSKNRTGIAKGQFFRSIMNGIVMDGSGDNQRVLGQFHIDAGRNSGGRSMRNAMAFYEVGNVKYVYTEKFGGMNSFYSAGKMISNSNLRIEGYATFASPTDYIIQNQATPITFVKDAQGKGDVYFEGNVRFMQDGLNCSIPAYFNNSVEFHSKGNSPPRFTENVAVRGNLYSDDNNKGKFQFGANAWLGGNLGDWNGGNAAKTALLPNAGTSKLYHTDQLDLSNPSRLGGFGNEQRRELMSSFNKETILNTMNIKPLEQRSEPKLAMDNAAMAERGKSYMNLSDVVKLATGNPGNTNSVSGKELDDFIKTARNNPAYANNFYNGHLLINADVNDLNIKDRSIPFNEKMILNIDNSFSFASPGGNCKSPPCNGGNFFESGPNASTLVYLGPNGQMHNFGCNDLFRGLIYVDEANEKDHTFLFSNNTLIDGAALVMGNKSSLVWNSGSHLTTIRRNEEILNQFGGLKDNSNGGNMQAELKDSTTAINLKPFGFYYY